MKNAHLGMMQLHAAVLLFGLAGLFGKFLVLPPLVIVLGRTAFASAVLIALLLISERGALGHLYRSWKWLVLSGVILAAHWGTFFHSIQISTVAVGLLTFSSFPLFVTLLEPCFFKERWRWLDLVTALLVLLGLVLIIPRFDLDHHLTRGACWGILSGLTFAILSLMNRRLVAVHPPVVLAASQNAVATVVLMPAVWPYMTWPDARSLLLLAILGIVCTALAHALFIKSLSHVRAQLASVVAGLESIYGIVFAFLLLGEVPASRTMVGGIIVLGAVVLATAKRHQAPAVPASSPARQCIETY